MFLEYCSEILEMCDYFQSILLESSDVLPSLDLEELETEEYILDLS